MNKVKLFVENFLVYGLGSIISKIIPLVMVPIITRIMPSTEYFGISDLSNTVVSFGSALAIMGMYDAMYRMFFEKDESEYKRVVCSTALSFTMATSMVVFILMIAFRGVIAKYFFSDTKYSYVVYISAVAVLVGGTNSIVSAPTRMQNNRKVFLITNTLSPLLSYAISIPLLYAGYYTIALPLAAVISGVTMEVTFWLLNRRWFQLRMFDKKLLRQLLFLAIPLFPNFLIYWVFNSCDKVMITNTIGIGAAGIYSVGSKLGHASQLIYVAFASGWQYFAFSTMKEERQVETNSKIFEYLGVISFATTGFVCAWSFPLFKLLFTEEYLSGYIVAPYLFLAPLLQMLFQIIGNQFLIIKKTWPTMVILSSGALLNIIANYILIPVLGIEGASIATLIGYIVADLICVYVLRKMKLFVLSSRFIKACLSMCMYMLLWRLVFSREILIGTIVAFVNTAVLIFLYRREVEIIMGKIKRTK